MSQINENLFETHVEEILMTRDGWKSGSSAEWGMEWAPVPAPDLAVSARG